MNIHTHNLLIVELSEKISLQTTQKIININH